MSVFVSGRKTVIIQHEVVSPTQRALNVQGSRKKKIQIQNLSEQITLELVLSGAHYPEHATSLFSCNGVFTSRVIFRYAFPAKFSFSGYVRIEI